MSELSLSGVLGRHSEESHHDVVINLRTLLMTTGTLLCSRHFLLCVHSFCALHALLCKTATCKLRQLVVPVYQRITVTAYHGEVSARRLLNATETTRVNATFASHVAGHCVWCHIVALRRLCSRYVPTFPTLCPSFLSYFLLSPRALPSCLASTSVVIFIFRHHGWLGRY